jgi:uncharacterized SAM-binding protein YcdF (DUF218 family)
MKKIVKFVFAAWLTINLYTAIRIGCYPVSSPNLKADVAMVLGSPVKENKPSKVFASRLDHGIHLYKTGKVEKILIAGGKGSGTRLSEAEAGKNYVLESGIPEKAILTETRSTTTFENFRFSKQILKENNLKTVVVVSDPFHMSRSMMMAKDHKIEAYSSPTLTSQFQSIDSKIVFILMEIPKFQVYMISRLF